MEDRNPQSRVGEGQSYSDLSFGEYSENAIDYAENYTQNVFQDWFTPKDKERRQYGQQLLADLEEPSYRMEGLKRAGINPLTAAAGVAGTASSVPQPASSTNPIGDVLGAAGALTSGVGALGTGFKALKEGLRTNDVVNSTIQHQQAEIDRWSHENGYTDAQTNALKIDLETRSDMNKAELNLKIQNVEKMREEAEYIRGQKEYVKKELEWFDERIQSEIDLNKKQAIEAEKNAFLAEQRGRWQQLENDFREKYKYRQGDPFENVAFDLYMQGEYDRASSLLEFMYQTKYGVSYNEAKGQYAAQDEYAFSIANAQELAKSLNQIITDWNTSGSGLWNILDKSFNISGNKSGANNLGSAIAKQSDPDLFNSYSTMITASNMRIQELSKDIDIAANNKEFAKMQQLIKERNALVEFVNGLTFDDFKKRLYGN